MSEQTTPEPPEVPPARAPEPARPPLPEPVTTLVIHVRPGASVQSSDELVVERRLSRGTWMRCGHAEEWNPLPLAERIACAVDRYGEHNVRVVRITTHCVTQVLPLAEAAAQEQLIVAQRP